MDELFWNKRIITTDDNNHIKGLSENVKETAKLIMSSISSKELDNLLGRNTFKRYLGCIR